MTRDEAIDRVEAIYYGLRENPLGPGAQAVEILIALGLLKLDEPRSAEEQVAALLSDHFVKLLRTNGFKIVKA